MHPPLCTGLMTHCAAGECDRQHRSARALCSHACPAMPSGCGWSPGVPPVAGAAGCTGKPPAGVRALRVCVVAAMLSVLATEGGAALGLFWPLPHCSTCRAGQTAGGPLVEGAACPLPCTPPLRGAERGPQVSPWPAGHAPLGKQIASITRRQELACHPGVLGMSAFDAWLCLALSLAAARTLAPARCWPRCLLIRQKATSSGRHCGQRHQLGQSHHLRWGRGRACAGVGSMDFDGRPTSSAKV